MYSMPGSCKHRMHKGSFLWFMSISFAVGNQIPCSGLVHLHLSALLDKASDEWHLGLVLRTAHLPAFLLIVGSINKDVRG